MITLRLPPPTHFRARHGEWLVAAMLLGWGVNLDLAPTAFDLAPLAVLKALAPALVWGSGAIAIALCRLGALYVNGAWKASPPIRAATAMLSGLCWMVVAFGLMAGRIPNTGTVIYLGIATLDLFGAHQAARDWRVAWEHRKRGVSNARTSSR